MRQTDDQPKTDQPTNRRVTVPEAVALLGLSEDAVRSRLKRGTLRKEKSPDGTVLVVLGADGRAARQHPTAPDSIVAEKRRWGFLILAPPPPSCPALRFETCVTFSWYDDVAGDGLRLVGRLIHPHP